MISLQQIETDLVTAMKAKDQVAVDTLRGLKTRIQNEKVSKMKDLSEDDILALVRSEVKRRKEAAESFQQGGRQEAAEKELTEASILEKFLPAQMSEDAVAAEADKLIAEHSFTAADFGRAMGQLKSKLGNSADGSMVARVLKAKLK